MVISSTLEIESAGGERGEMLLNWTRHLINAPVEESEKRNDDDGTATAARSRKKK